MSHPLPRRSTSLRQRVALTIVAVGCAIGLTLSSALPAEALTRAEKRQQMQLLAAQEKLSYDVFTALSDRHGSAVFRLMARAEERDLKRIRRLLDVHGWTDLTSGEGPVNTG
jgi:hypothetical protein